MLRDSILSIQQMNHGQLFGNSCHFLKSRKWVWKGFELCKHSKYFDTLSKTKCPLLIFLLSILLQICYALFIAAVPSHLAYFPIYALVSHLGISHCIYHGNETFQLIRYQICQVKTVTSGIHLFSWGWHRTFFKILIDFYVSVLYELSKKS